MNPEKLKKLQAQVRIGGKGTPRRKKKIVHSTPANDDKKLQTSLKKLSVNTFPGIEEVNIIKNDGTVIHFNNPKTQASLPYNTFVITGHGENRLVSEMPPGSLTQAGSQDIKQLKKIVCEFSTKKGTTVGSVAVDLSNADDDDDDVFPDLVQNFEDVALGKAPPSAAPAAASAVAGSFAAAHATAANAADPPVASPAAATAASPLAETAAEPAVATAASPPAESAAPITTSPADKSPAADTAAALSIDVTPDATAPNKSPDGDTAAAISIVVSPPTQ